MTPDAAGDRVRPLPQHTQRFRNVGLWLLLPVMLFGILVGLLMTWHHDIQLFGGGTGGQLFGCAESAEVSCDAVNTSAYSEILGIPIATLAIPFYATVLALATLGLRSRRGARALVVAAGAGAVLYAAFLFYISKTQLGFVCAWCIRLYAVNLAILLLGVLGGRVRLPDRQMLVTAGSLFIGILLVSVGGERCYRAFLIGDSPTGVARNGTQHDRDPKGLAPALTFQVKTEDGKNATLTIEPDDPWVGNRDSKVAVVIFGDFECGYCKRESSEIARLETTYGDRVLFVFKHFPMDPACNTGVNNRKHPDACLAAKASECARHQGRFWAFHDLAFKNQHQLGVDYLRTYAVQAGASGDLYDACMATETPFEAVRKDAQAGTALDIHGTPRVYINGKLYRSGASAEVMAQSLETALGASAAEAAQHAATFREGKESIAPVPPGVPAMQNLTFGGLSFQMDTFEDAVADGVAVSEKHEIPALRSSWFEARDACTKAGKRLCTEEEWVSACQNARAIDDNGNGQYADDLIEGTTWPYGDFHDRGRCWDDHAGASSAAADEDDPNPAPGKDYRPVYTGEMPGCVTPTGIYDLTGNLEEWAGTTPESAVLLGGAWDTPEDHARCYRRNATFGPGYQSNRTGFRCCAN
jgi:protein-disulfide isomerase/uncharacterized membrane protein